MANPRLSFGPRSLAALGVLTILSQSFHPLLMLPMKIGETAGWLVLLIASGMAAAAGWIVAYALRAIPGTDLIDLARIGFGRVGAILTALAFAAGFTFGGGMILRETSEMAISVAFPHTPQTFATVALLVGSTYIAFGDAAGLVRLARVVVPVVVGALLLICVGVFPWGRPQFLTPFWGPGAGPLLLRAPVATIFFAPANLLPIISRGLSDRRKILPWAIAVPLLSGAILTVVAAVLTMVMPFPLSTSVTYPLNMAVRLLLGGRFFERLEGIWLFLWVLTTIILSGAMLLAVAVAFTRAFGIRRHATAVLPLAAVTMTVAFFPRNQAETVEIHHAGAYRAAVITLVIPVIVALAALWRRRGRAAP